MNPVTARCFSLFLVIFLSACGGPSGSDQPDNDAAELPRFDIRDNDQLYPYKADSPYASVLKQCALVEDVESACQLSSLPFIGQENPQVTREDILDRLLVTHDWMGKRFEQVLDEAPDDMIRLFASITSVSIGSEVRPSYYWSLMGGFFLDPAFLWLTVEEKATVATQPDFRSGFGRDLQFWPMYTLLKDGKRASEFFSLTSYTERQFEDIRAQVFELLFHELAHAADFMPINLVTTADRTIKPDEAIDAFWDQHVAVGLINTLPLYSNTLFDVAQVSYHGEEASEFQKTLTAYDMGAEMAIDGASEYYAYSTFREDAATLFAAAMMKKHFDVDVAIAFVQKPADENSYGCDELLVGWGARNRVADPLVSPRARWVVEAIYGSVAENSQFFNTGQGDVSAMTPDVNWCSNLTPSIQATRDEQQSLDGAARTISREGELMQLLEDRKPRH